MSLSPSRSREFSRKSNHSKLSDGEIQDGTIPENLLFVRFKYLKDDSFSGIEPDSSFSFRIKRFSFPNCQYQPEVSLLGRYGAEPKIANFEAFPVLSELSPRTDCVRDRSAPDLQLFQTNTE